MSLHAKQHCTDVDTVSALVHLPEQPHVRQVAYKGPVPCPARPSRRCGPHQMRHHLRLRQTLTLTLTWQPQLQQVAPGVVRWCQPQSYCVGEQHVLTLGFQPCSLADLQCGVTDKICIEARFKPIR